MPDAAERANKMKSMNIIDIIDKNHIDGASG